ncbi:Uu.00g017920.m01.CDS01 [Anthostomella pinea]|uniref:Uu.00g017920.m01.CDS01 n=1 Tax=Anthostomella pinea TaxID=933095 RepID=A0AAI8VZ04_9PEZI|nr:Uu.00g017920.m01.CDS01 [Anthostomella pinea]
MYFSAAVLAFATSAFAQNQTGPFALHITGKTDKTIDGYGASCHSGAAIETLCYSAGAASASANQYYYNYSSYSPDTGAVSQPGLITWNLPFTSGANGSSVSYESQALELQVNLVSNVLPAMFGFGDPTYFSFHPDNGTFYVGSAVDDSSFNETVPVEPYVGPIDNFYLCYQYFEGYYYRSVGWALTTPPHNPSCEPVNVAMEVVA